MVPLPCLPDRLHYKYLHVYVDPGHDCGDVTNIYEPPSISSQAAIEQHLFFPSLKQLRRIRRLTDNEVLERTQAIGPAV